MQTGEAGKVLCKSRKQSGIWIIICQNDTMPLKEEVIETIYTKKSFSTKGGNHEEIGSQELNRIVKKYQGTLDFSAIDNTFILKIKIPDI